MKLNYQVKSGRLFSTDGQEITPDEKGRAMLTVNGSERLFDVAKFIAKLGSGTDIVLHNVAGKIGHKKVWDTPKAPKEKRVKKVKPKQCRAVIVTDSDGKETEYETRLIAADALKYSVNSIDKAIRDEYGLLIGLVFRRKGEKPKPKKPRGRNGPIIAFKDGFKKEYSSAKAAAAELNIARPTISLALNGKKKHAGGYQFKIKTA